MFDQTQATVRAGYNILINELGVTDEDITEILLAGVFENYIRRDQAKRIGLLPDVPKEKFRFIGNAAGERTKMVLLARDFRKGACEISKKVEYLELSARKDFQDEFMDTQFFPRA